MNTLLSFELSKLLKEKGFDKNCNMYYHTGGTLKKQRVGWLNEICEAPTITEVVMWLYEKHGIWVNVSITIQKEYFYQCIDITGKKDPTKNNYPSRICKAGNYYNSPTEAYEASIEYTLNYLI